MLRFLLKLILMEFCVGKFQLKSCLSYGCYSALSFFCFSYESHFAEADAGVLEAAYNASDG